MKAYFPAIVLLILILNFNCRHNVSDFSYIKVFIWNSADTITAYNKDLGVASYAYYDLNKDSVVYRDLVSVDPNRYETYIGQLQNQHYVDTIRNLLRVLQRHANGLLLDTVPSGATYCGPDFYVEYRDEKGEHFHDFILVGGSDTLDQFAGFFGRIPSLPWKRKLVSNSLVNSDTEAVSAMKKLGEYDKWETPYIPMMCDSTIDKTKIFGSWRVIRIGKNRFNNYQKLTFERNGIYKYEKIKEGISSFAVSGTYKLNPKNNILTVNTGENKLTFKVLRLTDSCFQYMEREKPERITRLDKL